MNLEFWAQASSIGGSVAVAGLGLLVIGDILRAARALVGHIEGLVGRLVQLHTEEVRTAADHEAVMELLDVSAAEEPALQRPLWRFTDGVVFFKDRPSTTRAAAEHIHIAAIQAEALAAHRSWWSAETVEQAPGRIFRLAVCAGLFATCASLAGIAPPSLDPASAWSAVLGVRDAVLAGALPVGSGLLTALVVRTVRLRSVARLAAAIQRLSGWLDLRYHRLTAEEILVDMHRLLAPPNPAEPAAGSS